MRIRRAGLVAVAVLFGIAALVASRMATRSTGIVIPELSAEGLRGMDDFAHYCAGCHGTDAGGTDKGPPLIHPIYAPGHHGDVAIQFAVRGGSRAHHWNFGDMPRIDGVSDSELSEIIVFLRAVQRANGIG
jgi:mono/diheme cytochrome c family protein